MIITLFSLDLWWILKNLFELLWRFGNNHLWFFPSPCLCFYMIIVNSWAKLTLNLLCMNTIILSEVSQLFFRDRQNYLCKLSNEMRASMIGVGLVNSKKMIFEWISNSKPWSTPTVIPFQLTLDLAEVFFNHCKSLYSIATFSHYKYHSKIFVPLII